MNDYINGLTTTTGVTVGVTQSIHVTVPDHCSVTSQPTSDPVHNTSHYTDGVADKTMTVDDVINKLQSIANWNRRYKDGDRGLVEACTIAVEALKKRRWISVNESLPETDKEVLCWVRYPNSNYDYGIDSYSDGKWYFESGELCGDYQVIYWTDQALLERPNE